LVYTNEEIKRFKVREDLEVKDNTIYVKVGKGKIYTVEVL